MNSQSDFTGIQLTKFSHGGGCGCKISPAVLSRLLADMPPGLIVPELMVGTSTSDDAAVYRLNDQQALIATTDFFTPIVDNPFDFGCIAAANALSDVYAMGGKPILALALVGMPLDKLPEEAIRAILAGGEEICRRAGIPVAGGHSIDVPEPIYGLVALGLVHPDRVKRNCQAQAGDVLILGKPLGIGILSAALKKGELTREAYARMLALTTQLNTPGITLAEIAGVNALTDVTGFGLAGHLLEICRGSGLAARIDFSRLPLIAEAVALAQAGMATGASGRNWKAYGDAVSLPANCEDWQKKMLTDPQTSGGLLVACKPECVDRVLALFTEAGFAEAAAFGCLEEGTPTMRVDSD